MTNKIFLKICNFQNKLASDLKYPKTFELTLLEDNCFVLTNFSDHSYLNYVLSDFLEINCELETPDTSVDRYNEFTFFSKKKGEFSIEDQYLTFPIFDYPILDEAISDYGLDSVSCRGSIDGEDLQEVGRNFDEQVRFSCSNDFLFTGTGAYEQQDPKIKKVNVELSILQPNKKDCDNSNADGTWKASYKRPKLFPDNSSKTGPCYVNSYNYMQGFQNKSLSQLRLEDYNMYYSNSLPKHCASIMKRYLDFTKKYTQRNQNMLFQIKLHE